MFKHAAVTLWLLTLSTLACAQQPVYWLPFWIVPPTAQPVPFPTPFWLWRMPPPMAQPAAKPEPAPMQPAPQAAEPVSPAGAPVAAPLTPVPVPALTAPPAAAPRPIDTPPAAQAPDVLVEQPSDKAVIPPAAAPVKALSNHARQKVPAKPDKARRAAKKTARHDARVEHQPRKLCFKDGRLDVCP